MFILMFILVSVFSVDMYDGEEYVGMGTIVARTCKVHNIRARRIINEYL